jgi:PAS domain S-box-containing protein
VSDSGEQQPLLDSSSQGIYRLDPDGCCTYVNPAAARLLDWSIEALIGQDMHWLSHRYRADGDPYPWQECPIGETLRSGKGVRIDGDLMWRRDGSSFPSEYACAPILGPTGIQGVVVTFTDISPGLTLA